MTTETKNNETKNQTNEQSTFAPLGKYAAIGVVIVGVIVTTAVMLDKQLNKTETQIASIEDEISKLNKAKAAATATTAAQAEVQAPAAASATSETVIDEAPVTSTATNSQQTEAAVTTEEVASNETESKTESQQAGTVSHKVKQKTHMTEMFDRINERENKQLEKFKAQQAEQVARLRKQFNVQQQQIDALIKRNENLFNLRSASMQRSQAQREQMLNRI